MRKFCPPPIALVLSAMLMSPLASATVITEGFDAFSDTEALTNQITGMTFTNASVLAAGFSLNESEFPPRSDFNVVFDDGGELTIDFDSPVFEVAGYFTYLTQVTLSAYDSSLNLVASDVSDFLTNLALSGDAGSTPNELLGVSSATGISRIVITGDPSGSSFVMDDLTVTTSQVVTVPEPGTIHLLLAAAAAAAIGRRWAKHPAGFANVN